MEVGGVLLRSPRRLIALIVSLVVLLSLGGIAPAQAATLTKSGSATLFASTAIVPVTPDYQAGVYDYTCEESDGSTVALKVGEATSDCKGTYLIQYLDNGTYVKSVPIAKTGPEIKNPDSFACAMTKLGAIFIIFTPQDAVAWAGAGVIDGVSGFHYCKSGRELSSK